MLQVEVSNLRHGCEPLHIFTISIFAFTNLRVSRAVSPLLCPELYCNFNLIYSKIPTQTVLFAWVCLILDHYFKTSSSMSFTLLP